MMKILIPIKYSILTLVITGLSSCGSDSEDDSSPYSSYSSYKSPSTTDPTSSTTYTPYYPYYTSPSSYQSDTCENLDYIRPDKTYNCITIPTSASVGDEHGLLTVNGTTVLLSNIGQTITDEVRRARRDTGDREWSNHLDQPTFYSTLTITQGAKTIASSRVYNGRSTIALNSTTMKLVTSSDDAKPRVEIEAMVSGQYCVVLTGEGPIISAKTTTKVDVNIRSLAARVYKYDCKSPLTDYGGLATLTKLIRRGASKTEVSAVMGTTGLTITSATKWNWQASSTPACVASTTGECSVTFDSSGTVTATKGIKGAYLDLSTW
jgi:hypothetical protein